MFIAVVPDIGVLSPNDPNGHLEKLRIIFNVL